MSGSAGGNRIQREHVENTVRRYYRDVLKNLEYFYINHIITGSYNVLSKQDFGDIDLILHVRHHSIKEAKQKFIDIIKELPDFIIVPFKSVKYNGKKYLNTGEIVTVLFPIIDQYGYQNGYVQIDNIFAVSKQEAEFKHKFLSFPASVQGLILGLIKTVILEHGLDFVKNELDIYNFPLLEDNQEFEFNISSSNITLRLVTLNGFRTVEKFDVYRFNDWKIVEKLLFNYDLDSDFDSLLEQAKNQLKHSRSKNRIKGMFKKMVSVKSGEINTEKGDEKIRTLGKIDTI